MQTKKSSELITPHNNQHINPQDYHTYRSSGGQQPSCATTVASSRTPSSGLPGWPDVAAGSRLGRGLRVSVHTGWRTTPAPGDALTNWQPCLLYCHALAVFTQLALRAPHAISARIRAARVILGLHRPQIKISTPPTTLPCRGFSYVVPYTKASRARLANMKTNCWGVDSA